MTTQRHLDSCDRRTERSVSTDPRRVVVVDDHHVFLDSLVHVIDQQADLEVVGTAATITQLREHLIHLAPDVVVLDCNLPDGDAVEHLAEIKTLAPDARVVVLTSRDNPRLARDSIIRGADAFLSKSAALGQVLEVLRDRSTRRSSPRRLPSQVPALTVREWQVLDLMARGLTNPAIAADLGLSTFTVKNHVASICTKTSSHSKLQAVSIARSMGLFA